MENGENSKPITSQADQQLADELFNSFTNQGGKKSEVSSDEPKIKLGKNKPVEPWKEKSLEALQADVGYSRSLYCQHLFGKNIVTRTVSRGTGFIGGTTKELKTRYTEAKLAYAKGLWIDKKAQTNPLSGPEINALILEKGIIEEREAFRQKRADILEEKEKNVVVELSKKLIDWYRKQPQWRRVVGSAILVTGAVVVLPYAPIIGGTFAGFLSVKATALFAGNRIWRGALSSIPAHFIGIPISRWIDKKVSPIAMKNKEKRIMKLKENFTQTALKDFEKAFKKGEHNYKYGVQWREGRGKFYKKFAQVVPVLASGVGIAGIDQVWGVGGKIRDAGGAMLHHGGANTTNAFESLGKSKDMKNLLKMAQDATGDKNLNTTTLLEKLHVGKGLNKSTVERLLDYEKRGYVDKIELQKLLQKASNATIDKPFTIQDLNRMILYSPDNRNEFLQYLKEIYGEDNALYKKYLNQQFDVRVLSDGKIQLMPTEKGYNGGFGAAYAADESFTGETVTIDDEGKLHVTPKPADVTPKPADVTPKPADVTPKPADVTPKPADVTPKPADVTPKPADVTPKPADVTPKPADVTHTYKHDIGKLGPEGAMIKWLKENPTKADAIAEKLGISDSNDYGRIAHKSWLESMKNPATRDALGKAGLVDKNPDTITDELAGMRRIAVGGKIVIDPATGTMSFEDTHFLKPQVVNHTSLAAAPHPVASPSQVVEPPPSSGVPLSSSPTPPENLPSRASYADQLLDQAKIPAEAHSGLKETLVKNIAEKGSADPASVEGKTLDYLKNFYRHEDLLSMNQHGRKKLKYLLESMVDNKGELTARPI